jgi:glycine cleavage system H lipoate-binding protein
MAPTPWRPFGIDYSDDAEQYVESLKHVGKVATPYKGDIFETPIDLQFERRRT